jgi:hypothetical protein
MNPRAGRGARNPRNPATGAQQNRSNYGTAPRRHPHYRMRTVFWVVWWTPGADGTAASPWQVSERCQTRLHDMVHVPHREGFAWTRTQRCSWGSYLAKLTFLSTVFQYISSTGLCVP